METERKTLVLRAHLFKMTMLTQRAVDYSTKAYELGGSEFWQLIQRSDQEWCELQRLIGNRGRMLLAAGIPVDADSSLARCTLRIYSALRVAYTAAHEITHNSMLLAEGRRTSGFESIGQMARFVNGLMRLCTVALFERKIHHAESILHNEPGRAWFDRTLDLAHNDVLERAGAEARFELAIARSLGQINEQVLEIAEALAGCLGGRHDLRALNDLAA
jgi:hypothetical protein